MKISQPIMIAGVVLVVAIIVLVVLPNTSTKYDAFAQCLTEKGTKMYGAYWCPHCNDEKAMFGASWKYVTYIECSNSDGSQTSQCKQAGIKSYPTWEFSGGKRQIGPLSFETLSQKTNCSLPS